MKINSLHLRTSKVSELFAFYSQTLGMDTERAENGFLVFTKNGSSIHFHESAESWYYHFAFNIPENRIEQATEFVKSFATPLPDPDTQNEIIDFPAWNAHSVYFKDPADNIVEFIARHDLSNAERQPLGPDSILEISEIGTPCADVRDSFDFLHNTLQLNRYSGNFNSFCPTGDEHGLFILTKMDRNWFPSNLKSIAAPYQIEIESPPRTGKKSLDYAEGILRLIIP